MAWHQKNSVNFCICWQHIWLSDTIRTKWYFRTANSERNSSVLRDSFLILVLNVSAASLQRSRVQSPLSLSRKKIEDHLALVQGTLQFTINDYAIMITITEKHDHICIAKCRNRPFFAFQKKPRSKCM